MEHQAWIVRKVLTQLERQVTAGEEAPSDIAVEFARLRSQSNKYRTNKTYPTKTADTQDNVKKNRYKDIVPFDHSRVKLTLSTSKNDTDYINASFIEGASGSRAYIATQGPLPHTILDFMRMLWEYNIKVVVMACREFEMGKKKCECYWPQKVGQPFVCEPFTVYCDSEENRGDYLTRTLRLDYHNCSRTLKQLHYVTWPDHGVPNSIPPILEMLDEMRTHQADEDVPICIHCSAGCGRTGALCAIDYTCNLLKSQMITPDFNIFDLVQNMRTQRPSLVQTKEQYELVYRTIKLLFDRYLQSVDAFTHSNELTVVSSAVTPDTESELSDMNEELDMLSQLQHLLDEEIHFLRQNYAPSPPASENLTALKSKDAYMDRQQWHPLQTLPEALIPNQELQEGPSTSPKLVHSTQKAPDIEEERTQDIGNTPLLNPAPSAAVAAAICLMVEDPYFDSPVSSPSSEGDSTKWTVSTVFSPPSVCLNDQTVELNSLDSGADEEVAPPLPQRTLESFVLAVDAARPDPCEKPMVIIPPNAAAETVRELGGSLPSSVPPLPERTPESFELAIDQAPVEQKLKVPPAVNLNRIGMSSEWSGNSKPAAAALQNEMKCWARSKSLKAKMTSRAVAQLDLSSNAASSLHPYCPPQDPLTPVLPQTEESPTPPLPDRTPESFILTTEEVHKKTFLSMQPLETTPPLTRVGLSSEWDGNAQPKKFLDVGMNRSKSAKAKSSRQEPRTTAWQLTPPPLVVGKGGSGQVHVNAETSGNKLDEKSMFGARRLKFFRHKQKPKIAPLPPPPQPATAPTANGISSSVFKLGFGNRFGKPRGPRSYPETWV